MNLRFEHPSLFLLALLALPLVLIGLRATAGMDPVRRWTALTLRVVLLALIAAVLAGPHAVREHDQVTVVGLMDISGSVQRFADLPPVDETGRRSNIEYLRHWLRQATESRRPDDRVGLVAFDGQAVAISAPTAGPYVDDNLDMPMVEGTNIAEAIRLGLAMLPGDTGRRLVLISDGNETMGDALEAARQAAGGGDGQSGVRPVPIDILPIDYQVTGDVQIVRIEAPPTAQPGQTVTVRIVMEATEEAAGRLSLRREGEPVDLDPERPGHSRHVSLPAGPSVHLAQVTLGETPINRFVAVYEPDDPARDALPDNNRAEAFIATPSRGNVLIVSEAPAGRHWLADVLAAADIPVEVQPAQLLPDDLLSLQNHDLIVLDNVASFELSEHQHDLLARYVTQLGGGLMKTGGERSFGAGGWMRTRLAEVLPLRLDPPRELRAPRSALVLVIDRSGSMNRPVGGARATQQEVANEGAALAIESLRAETYVGVVAFDHMPEEYIPLQPNEDASALAERVRGIRAAGGTRIEPALRMAHGMMADVEVENRHIVLLTDGISRDPDMESFVARLAGEQVRVTTIGVGDDIDREQLRMIADGTGGVFHHVRNPRVLPRVLVDSVQDFNKPLIREGSFRPVVRPTGSPFTAGMEDAPPLGGLVITAPHEDPRAVLEMQHPEGEPLLAQWQVGLGRVAAFTSDIGGRWSRQWDDWPGAAAFWTQMTRTIARPAVSPETELLVTMRDNRLNIVLEAADEQEGFLDYLQVDGSVYLPDGRSVPVRLRQSAPGRYEAQMPAQQAGSYIVALNPRHGSRQLAPVIGGASRATSEEFRRYTADIALLEEIAQVTGGRVLSLGDPAAVNLFDRAEMPRSASMLPMWQPLLWLIVIVLLLDVACRRIAWDWPLLKALAIAAVRKVTPARVRGERAAATVSVLRRVGERFDQQEQARSGDVEKLAGTGRIVPPPPRPKESSPQRDHERAPQPDGSRIASALDALLGRRSGDAGKAKSEPAEEAAKPRGAVQEHDAARADSSGKPSPAGGMRRNLLAAKKRARKRLEDDGERGG